MSAGGSIRRACLNIYNRPKIIIATGLASELITIILFTILMSNAHVNLKNSANVHPWIERRVKKGPSQSRLIRGFPDCCIASNDNCNVTTDCAAVPKKEKTLLQKGRRYRNIGIAAMLQTAPAVARTNAHIHGGPDDPLYNGYIAVKSPRSCITDD
jgi:hypothetical protein